MAKNALPIVIGAGALLLFMGGGKKSKKGSGGNSGGVATLPSWADGVDLGPLPKNVFLVDRGAPAATAESWMQSNYPLVIVATTVPGHKRNVVGRYLIELANAYPDLAFLSMDPAWATDAYQINPDSGITLVNNAVGAIGMKDLSNSSKSSAEGVVGLAEGQDPLVHLQQWASPSVEKMIEYVQSRSSQMRKYGGSPDPLGEIAAALIDPS